VASYQTMSRKEAEKIAAWVEEHLITWTPVPNWQREFFITMLMYPDLEFEMTYPRG
jgi:hypothetical protein